MSRWIFATAMVASLVAAQPGQWCPTDPMPDCNDDGTSCKGSCDVFGDPVTIAGVNSFHKTTDFVLETGKGPLFFSRSYTSSSATWDLNNSHGPGGYLRPESPRPFSGTQYSQNWWHNLFSFVVEQKTGWTPTNPQYLSYVSESGIGTSFRDPQPDGGAGRWLSLQTGLYGTASRQTSATPRFQRLGNGIAVVRPDGRIYEYTTSHEQGTASYRLLLLTLIRDQEGTQLASLSYADPPSLSCPRLSGGASPYISQLTTSSGHSLIFNWDRAPSGTADRRCFIKSVLYSSPAGETRLMAAYGYNDLGSGARQLNSVVNGADGGESYSYGSVFRVERPLAGPYIGHSLDAGPGIVTALESYGNGPKLTIAHNVGNFTGLVGPVVSHDSCLFANYGNQTIATMYGTTGASSGASSDLIMRYVVRSDDFLHRKVRYSVESYCAAADGCSAGYEYWIPGPAGAIGSGTACDDNPPNMTPTRIVGHMDKKGNASSFPLDAYDAGMPQPMFLTRSYGVGGQWTGTPQFISVGSIVNLLESEGYSWRISPNGTPKKTKISRLSVLGGSNVYSETLLDYDVTASGGLRLKSEITTGYTKADLASWATTQRFRATFFRAAPGDSMDRTGDVEGPCWVSSPTATTCDPSLNSTWPVVRFQYHPVGAASGKNSGRLQQVTTFASDAGMAPLTTQFSNYTADGDPMLVTDENGVTTTLTYEGRRVKSQQRAVSGASETTTWHYDDDRVAAVGYPEGNYEVFCYRTGGSPALLECTGTLTSKLRWKAKTSGLPATSANWTERVVYTYDANGFLVDEERWVSTESASRYKRHYNPDLQGRETFAKMGGLTSGQDFRSTAHFDAADNRDAYGPPMNLPPDYCKSAGAESSLCWWFRYDRANRLNRANAPGSLSRSCFDYDAVGNIKGVTIGDATGGGAVSCDTSFNAPSQTTAASSSSTSIQYTWDDFGNIVQVKNSGIDDAASSGTRYLYDAQGNVVEKQTAAMGAAYKQRFGYDGLGRLTRADSFQSSDGGVQVLYQLDYDVPTGSPTGTLVNLKGRLSRRTDSYGDTWYSYDEAGRTKAEFRKRSSCVTANRGVLCEPHTLYTWDKNGNLTQIRYPYGRAVNYVYGTGGFRDRVVKITAEVFLSGGTTTRDLLDAIAWEPYGGLRAYQPRLNGGAARSVEYFLGSSPESAVGSGLCDDGVSGPPDGSGRLRGLFVGTDKLALNSNTHIPGTILSQRYVWNEDQLGRQKTCLGGTTGTGYQQDFTYDAMQRLTAESSLNTPHSTGDSSLGATKAFDSRGNRTDGTRDGYSVLDFAYDTTAKDRLNKVGWWYGFLNATDYFVKYEATHNASGVVTKIEANKPLGGSPKWTMDLAYSSGRAISDVFTSVKMNGTLVYDYFYDAFGRRRMKRDPFSNGYEFTYDLGHQLLVDQTWVDTEGYGSNLDEYVWLDGRPVVAFRGRVNATGVHETETLTSPPGSMACSRPEEGDLDCGAFHLVSNQQNFVILSLSDYDGKVSSFSLPDADGVINQSRFVAFGGYGTSLAEAFDVPETFSKDARFRTVYTGGWQTDWGWWGGVDELRLTKPGGGFSGLYPYGAEWGRAWSPRVGPMTGNQNVTWSSVCSTNCASATDMLEWRVWETGAPRFNTRLRFPGQYHDAETDFYENWNRFYDPPSGRYLSSEPLLHAPESVISILANGLALPGFQYGRSNPVAFVDPDGLDPGSPFPFPEEAATDALAYTYPRSTSEGWEYSGRICYGNRGYTATEPVPGKNDWTSEPPECPTGMREWGRYHTHGSNTKGANEPTPQDVSNTMNKRFSPNSFVAFPNGGVSSIRRGQVTPVLPPGTLSRAQAPGGGPPFPNKLNRKFQPSGGTR